MNYEPGYTLDEALENVVDDYLNGHASFLSIDPMETDWNAMAPYTAVIDLSDMTIVRHDTWEPSADVLDAKEILAACKSIGKSSVVKVPESSAFPPG